MTRYKPRRTSPHRENNTDSNLHSPSAVQDRIWRLTQYTDGYLRVLLMRVFRSLRVLLRRRGLLLLPAAMLLRLRGALLRALDGADGRHVHRVRRAARMLLRRHGPAADRRTCAILGDG